MREEHLDQVLRIERASFASPWRHEHVVHEIRRNPHAVCWVFRRGDQVLAYTCAWILEDELTLNNVAVHAAARRKGLGRRLLRELLAYARSKGCRHVRLDVRPSNRAARSLYEAEGFVEQGRRKGYYRDEDAILMGRPL